MKKTRKRCLGLFGLASVVAMTAIAANTPLPEASATSSTVTDTITVRVVGSVPDIGIHGIVNNAVYTNLEHDFTVDYENVQTMTLSLEYTDSDGNTTTAILDETTPDYVAGTEEYKISDYGYGKYIVTARGVGYDGVYDEDSVIYYYLPVYAESDTDDITGKHYVDLEYSSDDEGSASEVTKVVINVYDESGKLVDAISPIVVTPPATRVEIPFAANNLPSGTYTVSVSAYGADGKELYKPYTFTIEYKAAVVPDAGAPDTGGLFQNLNISSEDYLVSGLILFFVLGIVAFGIIARNKKSNPKKRH